jgi:hypothetical protein
VFFRHILLNSYQAIWLAALLVFQMLQDHIYIENWIKTEWKWSFLSKLLQRLVSVF